MRFYVCNDSDGETFDCVLKLSEAKQMVAAEGGGTIQVTDVSVTAENIRKLLGNLGGYAKEIHFIDINAT